MNLSGQLPNNAQGAVDVGSSVYWYARHLRLPHGIAVKLARPERPVVVISGDGAMQMAAVAGLVTVSQRWKDWQEPSGAEKARNLLRTYAGQEERRNDA